ncbi:MAG: hypothetical protein MK200_03395 [Nitrosopumilus sp.]|jgi:hypothetical protein|nr:hypothetical protein [Nitrosopumilus sp.]
MARSIPLIFEDVAAANSIKARKKILLENESNQLKELLKYAFHPDIKFALPPGKPPYKTIGSPDEYNPTYLYPNIRKFYLYIEGGHDGLTQLRREQLFVQMLESLHPKEAEVVIQIKDKKLNYRGLTYKLVKTTFPEILP